MKTLLQLLALGAAIIAVICFFFAFTTTNRSIDRTYAPLTERVGSVKAESASRRNYASKSLGQQITQVYEQTATLRHSTPDYKSARRETVAAVKKHEARIQSETTEGLPDDRHTDWTFAVSPDQFDQLVEALSQIGNAHSFIQSKDDRTTEFRALTTETENLRNQLKALEALKAQLPPLAQAKEPGKELNERVAFETKLLELRSRLNQIDSDLDDFVGDEQVATIHFTLQESFTPQEAKRAFDITLLFIGIISLFASLVFLGMSRSKS